MSNEELKHSTTILKKVVPLMMQHKIATTPSNYALWYTYVDQSNPDLTTSMDKVVQEHGTCPPSANQALYKEYVAGPQEANISDLKQSLEIMATELSSSMNDTLTDSTSFSNMIDKNFSDLERVEDEGLSMEEVMGLVRNLIKESKSIRNSASFFNNQLTNATSEINRLKQQLAEVQKDALFDGLSNLYNRRAFDNDMEALMKSGQKFSLVILDLDHFKSLNDQYGHLLGDAVIRAVAKRLQNNCREGISAYRYGGEEFALVIPNKGLRVSRQFAEATRRSIEKLIVKDKRSGNSVSSITASFGVAEVQPNETFTSLLSRADKLLYEAKQLGRNRVMPL
ncbi:GGDEF domain-containing protein [Vibrio maerlii]|uniref:GGDEF domain-containing protein n=1 Tax=Vibrio maerlii TaxID=2231648 RepID=UPI000E3C74A6|nr:GGDEF domain-containing protein [Vibrio maerlii]